MTIDTALAPLQALLGDRFSRARADRDHHSRSESHFPPIAPDAVVWPLSTEEVAAIVRICADHDCPVIGWGGGTSLEGHGLAVRGGVTVDFTRMDRILEVNAEDMDVRVQPGVTREALNEALRATGLFFPVDPGANATLGGMAMTRASGTTAVRYGTMRDNVRALEVVLADGRVIRTGSRARKSSTGYDLTALMVGSEGTLGLVTELTLRLQGQPEAVSTAVCAFDSLGDAVAAVTETIQMGIPMARIEFIDAEVVAAVNAYSGLTLPLAPHLLVEFHGSDAAVAEQAARFGEIAADHRAVGIETATRAEDRTKLWQARHKAHWAVLAAHPGKRALVTDACVPISRLAEAVAETQADIAQSRLTGPILGHMGDGNFHAILLIDPADPKDVAAADDLSHRLSERALRLGGTVSGEHGIGMGKLRYMAAEHGPGWEVMGLIKAALDPQNLLNPGKLVPQA
jgi:D-lactate dehydrogenase (cytochrome)